MPTLLDTHAWVWWVTEDRRLSRAARRAIERSQAKGDLSLSLISVWEVATKVEQAQLVLDRPVDQWLDSALAWVYLVVMGSLVGFTAYAWLLRVAPISLVVTHQFVNPLVAIALGMLFLGERPSPWTLAGALLVIGAVYVALRAESPRKTRPATVAPRGTPADLSA